MDRIIKNFETIEDVEKTMQWLEDNNTDIRWGNGILLAIETGWKSDFKEYQNDGGFCLHQLEDRIYYGPFSAYSDESLEEISFKDLIGEITVEKKEEKEWIPERGEVVEVSDTNIYREERIYLTKIELAKYPYIFVAGGDESKFKNGEKYDTAHYRYIRKLESKPEEEYKVGDNAVVTSKYDDSIYYGRIIAIKCVNKTYWYYIGNDDAYKKEALRRPSQEELEKYYNS